MFQLDVISVGEGGGALHNLENVVAFSIQTYVAMSIHGLLFAKDAIYNAELLNCRM